MIVDLTAPNEGFCSILKNPYQIVAVDANFFLPPDRTRLGARSEYSFDEFRRVWIEPLHILLPNLAVHEAVRAEIVDACASEFVSRRIAPEEGLEIQLLCDSDLSPEEAAVRNTKERLIAGFTKYEPARDNKDDRGEVKTLAYMGAVGYTYFASNDANALRLVEDAERLGTSLDDLKTIRFFEGIYFLLKKGATNRDDLHKLYRYLYHLTKNEKQTNPSWQDFCERMDHLYHL